MKATRHPSLCPFAAAERRLFGGRWLSGFSQGQNVMTEENLSQSQSNSEASPSPSPSPSSSSSSSPSPLQSQPSKLVDVPTVDDILIDKFGRKHTYLRISLTERCNLRCKYCMPEMGAELTPSEKLLSTEEILRIARIFVESGVQKIRLTGGEPSIRPDLIEIVQELSSMRGLKAIAMTSNGIALERKLLRLKEAGLSKLNISLDTLDREKFEMLTRRKGHGKVLSCIDSAIQMGFHPLKVNVVVMRGVNDDEVLDFVEMTRTVPINIRFIEYMPFDGNKWERNKMVSYAEMKTVIEGKYGKLEPVQLDQSTPRSNEVAKDFTIVSNDGQPFQGSVSFITSMTQNFCAGCTRLRLLADGALKVCLHGPSEVSLRDAMRTGMSEPELKSLIGAAVQRKKAAHAGMFELAKGGNRPMIHIGG